MHRVFFPIFAILTGCDGCGDDPVPVPGDSADTASAWDCVIAEGDEPDYAQQIGCWTDFETLSSDPLDASIPGAQSCKTVIDRVDGDELYFQNSKKYLIHWDFASEHLSGDGLPYVPDLSSFNVTEYYSPDRRFLLGAVTYYEEPEVFAYEISPYDTATADMIASAYYNIQENAYFGNELYFHPTSEAVEAEAEDLPEDVAIITTDELFEGITYQPLNLATSMGQFKFYAADEIEDVNYREIVVLDSVPNDIAVVAGIITSEFQTPLSHINVLSQNRGTPNMALRDAWDNEELRALEDKYVELVVEAMDYSIREVTQEEADQWWEENKPDPIVVTPMDTSVTDFRDEQEILDLETYDLVDALSLAVPVFGGKASHYGGLARIGDLVPHPHAFAIPVYYYNQFMEQNDFWPVVDEMLADKEFQGDSSVRRDMLEELQAAMVAAPIDKEFIAALTEKLEADYPDTRMRFRSSTNAEDVSGFNGAGLYDSESGQVGDAQDPIEDAIRTVWASLWSYRAFDEREYYSIVHTDIGMALLCHHSFPDEEANGVAITANIYDTTGMEPGFYVNVQVGEESVVFPEEGVTTDQFIYYYYMDGQPIVFLAHSSLTDEDENVLTTSQTYELGQALDAIHSYFYEAYGTSGGFYGMDIEFKFDDDWSDELQLWVKQARPYPGWGA